MRAQVYSAYPFTLTITATTPRAEMKASTKLQAGTIHEDYCARVRAVLREAKHIGQSSLAYPAAKRLQTYFPTSGSKPLYAVRELMPAGAPREFVREWQVEQMFIRYTGMLMWLPAALVADEEIAEAMEHHIQLATKQLFEANSVPTVYIPGVVANGEIRPMEQTEIDIVCEVGPGQGRVEVDLPTPTS